VGVLGILVPDHAVGPLEQLRAVGGRHAEQVGQVLQREVVGDLARQVAGAPPGHRAEQRGRPTPYDVGEPLQPPAGERARDDPPQPQLLRRVHVEDHAAQERQVGGVGVADLGGAERRGEVLRGAQDVLDVLVPRDRPESGPRGPDPDRGLLLPAHRVGVAQQAQRVVRNAPAEYAWIEDVDVRHEVLVSRQEPVSHIGGPIIRDERSQLTLRALGRAIPAASDGSRATRPSRSRARA
jgi:hypothetical protein